MDIRGFVNINNLRFGQGAGGSGCKAESKLHKLLEPMLFVIDRRVYEIDSHVDANAGSGSGSGRFGIRQTNDWRERKRELERERELSKNTNYQKNIMGLEIPENTFGVLCVARENICGGLVVANQIWGLNGVRSVLSNDKGTNATNVGHSSHSIHSRHSRVAKDLPPGFIILYPQVMSPFELIDSHQSGSATLLWLIANQSNEAKLDGMMM